MSKQTRTLYFRGEEISVNKIKGLIDYLKTIDKFSFKINLSACQMNDEMVELLADFLVRKPYCIVYLDLSGNFISDEGAKALAASLSSDLCGIIRLDLSGNEIGEAGACAISQVLEQPNNRLKKLKLQGNEFRDNGIKAIMEALKSPHCSLIFLNLLSGMTTAPRLEVMADVWVNRSRGQLSRITHPLQCKDNEKFNHFFGRKKVLSSLLCKGTDRTPKARESVWLP